MKIIKGVLIILAGSVVTFAFIAALLVIGVWIAKNFGLFALLLYTLFIVITAFVTGVYLDR